MNVDVAAFDAAVKSAVAHQLRPAKKKGRDDDGGAAKVPGRDDVQSVERTALVGFVAPFVARELVRRAVADVKGLVRLADAVDGGANALARKCLIGNDPKLVGVVKGAFERLGRGSYGAVLAIDRTRAVKVIRCTLSDLDDKMAAFATEVEMSRAAASLGVAPEVLDAFPCIADADGMVVGLIVMRRVVGKPLSGWLAEKPSKARREALAAKLEGAIKKLHRASVFHHDLHDNNVMVTKAGRDETPVIVDFGHASRDPARKWSFKHDENGRHRDFNILDDVKRTRDDGYWHAPEGSALVLAVLDDLLRQGIIRKSA